MIILLATDGSEYSEDSARFLLRFPLTPEDKVIVLHVISEIPYPDDYQAQIRRAIKRVAPKILHSAGDILKPLGAKIVMLEEEGYPDTAIIDTAEKTGSDLIVMGARGVRGVKLLFLGSTTRSVAINAARPVLVTGSPLKAAEGEMKVLFATDGSPSASETGRFLTSFPFPEKTEMTVMHVSRTISAEIPEKYLAEMDATCGEEIAMAGREEATEAAEIIEEARSHLHQRFGRICVMAKFGDPASEILQEARSINADIIAVGSRGLKGIKGMLGSVSRRVLGHAGCAVLIGKEAVS